MRELTLTKDGKAIFRKILVPILVVLALPVACGSRANDAAREEPVLRSPFVLKLHIDKEHFYEQKFERVPFVADGDVYLFAGEPFGVNVTVVGDRLSRITYQRDPVKADVVLKFTQEEAANGFTMLLVTRNKLKRKHFLMQR